MRTVVWEDYVRAPVLAVSVRKVHNQYVRLCSRSSSVLTGIFLLLIAHSAYADQNSAKYGIPFDVNNAGGADVSKSNMYFLSDSLGEPIVGHGDSAKYKLDSGYRQPSAADVISLSCTNIVNLGSVVGTGQKTGSGTCTVYTDAYDGYRMVWKSGSNYSSGLVGHWKLDETSGTTAYDASGNGNNGTLTNGPLISSDTPTKYLSTRSVSFDGVNDYIQAPRTLTSTTYSISAWIKPSRFGVNNSLNGFFYQGTGAGDNGTRFGVADCTGCGVSNGNTGTLFFENEGGGSYLTAANNAISLNVWQHVAITKTGATETMYINGTQVATRTSGNTTTPTQNNSSIGFWFNATDAARFFQGNIDDVRVFNRALSADAVRDLASKAPPGSLTASGSQTRYIPGIFFPSTGGLLGHWKFEETVGGSTAADSSGYNNDGTPNGAAGANNLPQPSSDVPGNTTFLTTRSLDFDGTDDYVSAAPTVGSTATFSFWASYTSLPNNYGMPFALSTGSPGPDLFFYNGHISWNTYDGDSNSFGNIPVNANDGSLHHYVVVVAPSNTKLYYDGNLLGSANYANPTSNVFQIGGQTNYFWKGKIDDARIYNRALTAAEIKSLYSVPQTWAVAATESAWGARLSTDSTDTDTKWGTDGGSEKWLNLGDGAYTVVRRATATPLAGSVEQMEFRGEVGSSKIQTSGVYRGVATFTVVGY